VFRKMITKKRAMVLGAVAVFAVAGIAVAFFTANGSGTGTATVGSASEITLAGTITGELYPAGTPAEVSVLVTNSGKGSQAVGSVHLASISTDVAHEECDLSVTGGNPAFTMADISVSKTLAAGGTTTVSGSLQMNDTKVTQNTCQGAPLTLHFTSN
jgi:hypothetical protein